MRCSPISHSTTSQGPGTQKLPVEVPDSHVKPQAKAIKKMIKKHVKNLCVMCVLQWWYEVMVLAWAVMPDSQPTPQPLVLMVPGQ